MGWFKRELTKLDDKREAGLLSDEEYAKALAELHRELDEYEQDQRQQAYEDEANEESEW